MVAQVLADAGQGVLHRDAEVAQPLGLADAGQFQQLRRIDRPGADHDLAPGAGLPPLAGNRVTQAGAAPSVEQQRLGERAGLDAQVWPATDRVEVAMRRAHPPPRGDGRLAHGDAVLHRAVVVGVVRDADLPGGLDQGGEDGVVRCGVGDAQRAVAAAERIVAAALVALHALEEGQHIGVAPAAVAHLGPAVEVLRLAADEGEAVDGTRPAEHPPARHRDAAAIGGGLGFRTVEPVHRRIGDHPRIADRNARPGVACGAGLQQQDRVARVGRKPVRHHRAGRAGTDDDVVAVVHSLPSPRSPDSIPGCRLRRRGRVSRSFAAMARWGRHVPGAGSGRMERRWGDAVRPAAPPP